MNSNNNNNTFFSCFAFYSIWLIKEYRTPLTKLPHLHHRPRPLLRAVSFTLSIQVVMVSLLLALARNASIHIKEQYWMKKLILDYSDAKVVKTVWNKHQLIRDSEEIPPARQQRHYNRVGSRSLRKWIRVEIRVDDDKQQFSDECRKLMSSMNDVCRVSFVSLLWWSFAFVANIYACDEQKRSMQLAWYCYCGTV